MSQRSRISCVDILGENDQDQMFEIRSRAYTLQYGEDVDVSALKWSRWDQRFINLGVFNEGQLVSVLRIANVKTEEDYKKIMLCPVDPSLVQLPVVILSRAATHQDFQSKGFHTLLRLHALHLTAASGVQWIVGTFKKNSARMSQLSNMGYVFAENRIPWNHFLKSHEATVVAYLNVPACFQQAEQRMLSSIESLNKTYTAAYDKDELIERLKKA